MSGAIPPLPQYAFMVYALMAQCFITSVIVVTMCLPLKIIVKCVLSVWDIITVFYIKLKGS